MLLTLRSLFDAPRHPCAAISRAFREQLLDRTAAAGRVYNTRLVDIDVREDAAFPAILIYVREESRDVQKDYGVDGQESWARSELRVIVEGLVRGGRTVDDSLWDLAFEVESALEDWIIPGFEGAEVRRGDVDIDVLTDFAKPVGAVGLIYHVTYQRPWRVADTPDDAFSIAGLTPDAVGTPDFEDPIHSIHTLRGTA